MSVQRLHALIWSLIYGGLVLLVIGFAVRRSDASIGTFVGAAGALAAAAGAVLVVVRARILGRASTAAGAAPSDSPHPPK